MYVKTLNNEIQDFPYSLKNLKEDNPNTSFPAKLSDEILAEWGVYRIVYADRPAVEHNETIVANAEPALIDGAWVLGWSVALMTDDEILTIAQDVRFKRDELLAECDWTQMPDSPLGSTTKSSWATYRTGLRDITEQAGFPTNITWPTAP
jgi:hypothetical protein